MDSVTLVNKRTNRKATFPISDLDHANCFQCEDVRDEATCVLVAKNVPARLASRWMAGEGDVDKYAVT